MPCPWLMTVDLLQQGDTMGQRQREKVREGGRKKQQKRRDVAHDARTPRLGHHPSQGTWTPAHAPQGEREGGGKKERKTRDVANDARTP